MKSFALSGTAFGLMSSMYFYAYMVMQIPVGLLADSWGARRTVAVGMLMGGAGALMFGLAPSQNILFLARFFIGIGMATVFVCLLKIQSQWFAGAMFGTLSGVSIFFGNLGGAAGQTPIAILTQYLGWRNSFVVIAVLTLIGGACSLLFVRNKPEDVGLPPVAPKGVTSQVGLMDGLRKVLAQKKMRAVALFYAFNQASQLAFVGGWLVPWLRDVHHLSLTRAANLGMLCVFGTMIGSVMAGSISDKLKLRKPIMIIGSVAATAAWAFLAFMKSDNQIVIAALLFFMGLGTGVFPLAMATTKELNSISVTGTAIAVLNTVGFFGIAVITSLLGVIADFGHYEGVIIACFVVSGLSTTAAFFSHETHAQNFEKIS